MRKAGGAWPSSWFDKDGGISRHTLHRVLGGITQGDRIAARWGRLSNEERFYLWVLLDAILDYEVTFTDDLGSIRYLSEHLATPAHRALRRAELMRWFRGAPAQITFGEIVEHFDINPAKVFRVLRKIAAKYGNGQ